MKVTLTLVNPQQKVSARTGKPYTALSIKTKEYGDRWLSGFGNHDNMNWAPGMEVHISVTEKENPKGGDPYLNFETLDPNTGDLIGRVEKIEAFLRAKFGTGASTPAPKPVPVTPPAPVTDDLVLDDLPF